MVILKVQDHQYGLDLMTLYGELGSSWKVCNCRRSRCRTIDALAIAANHHRPGNSKDDPTSAPGIKLTGWKSLVNVSPKLATIGRGAVIYIGYRARHVYENTTDCFGADLMPGRIWTSLDSACVEYIIWASS